MKKGLLHSLKKIQSIFQDEKTKEYCEYLSKKVEDLEEESVEREYTLPKEIKGTHDFAIFSDGGCRGNPGPGSWGIMAQNSKGEVLFEAASFDQETTNNKMELTGAIKAIEFLKDFFKDEGLAVGKMNSYLYTDSKYVVQGLNEWRHNWKKRGWKKADKKPVENLELWQKLDRVSEGFSNFKAVWVKGHNNHPQNERCDELCNEILDKELN